VLVPEPRPTRPAVRAKARVSGSAGISWTATVEADRRYYDEVSVDGVDFPDLCPVRTFTLIGSQLSIGRRSVSKGIYPEIDLSGPPLDPGISHLHAVLSLTPSGSWTVTDLGSTNGTTIDGGTKRIDAATAIDIGDSSQIHIGAWTTITVHAPG
jgi:hypothetical protein